MTDKHAELKSLLDEIDVRLPRKKRTSTRPLKFLEIIIAILMALMAINLGVGIAIEMEKDLQKHGWWGEK